MKKNLAMVMIVISLCSCAPKKPYYDVACLNSFAPEYSTAGCENQRVALEDYRQATAKKPDDGLPWYFWLMLPLFVVAGAADTVSRSPHLNDSYMKQPDAFGPGIHMDQYGRAVTLQPR